MSCAWKNAGVLKVHCSNLLTGSIMWWSSVRYLVPEETDYSCPVARFMTAAGLVSHYRSMSV